MKRPREHPSGVGAVGGRGSILYNSVYPLLSEVNIATLLTCPRVKIFFFQLNQKYGAHHNGETIEELRTAFEIAERSSPGITEHFIQLIFTKLQPEGEDRARVQTDRLTKT